MILPLAVVTTLAATCAPQVAPATFAAIAKTESGRDPLAIGDNTAHRDAPIFSYSAGGGARHPPTRRGRG